MRNKGTEGLRKLAKVTQLIRDSDRIPPKIVLLRSPFA